MMKAKTFEKWKTEFGKHLGYEVDEKGAPTLIWCATCREFDALESMAVGKGCIDASAYVKGKRSMKLSHFRDHIKKSGGHMTAVLRLGERQKATNLPAVPVEEEPDAPKQTTMIPYLHQITLRQRQQLTRKFQLCHFLVAQEKQSFRLYSKMANFERDIHKVDMGTGYTTNIACREMLHYLSEAARAEYITEPLNNGEASFYSVLNDGSSSAKTLDEKELFLIKTAPNGIPVVQVMSLEEPEDTNAEGLKMSMEEAITKMGFTFERKDHELGMCSDGAAVNLKLHRLVKEEMGDHYVFTHCPNHGFELAVRDAFKLSEIEEEAAGDLLTNHKLFKGATLRWRLFKRQSNAIGLPYKRYKRPNGTRWTEHQAAAIAVYLHNLPILIGFCNDQITNPKNATMKKLGPKLKGVLGGCTQLSHVLYLAIKGDILQFLTPLAKALQATELILPELITICKSAIDHVTELSALLDNSNSAIFQTRGNDIFKLTSTVLKDIGDDAVVHQEMQTRNTEDTSVHHSFHTYSMKGKLTDATDKCLGDFRTVIRALKDSMYTRLKSITEDELFVAVAKLLDTKCYKFNTTDELMPYIAIISDKFATVLEANNVDVQTAKSEFKLVHNHVLTFFRSTNPSNVWPQLFALKTTLGIGNIQKIAELCISLPIGNAVTERTFSYLWRIFSKERQSLSNATLNDILRLRADGNFEENRYKRAIDLFLTTHKGGVARKRKRRVDGYRQRKRVSVAAVSTQQSSTESSSSDDESEASDSSGSPSSYESDSDF